MQLFKVQAVVWISWKESYLDLNKLQTIFSHSFYNYLQERLKHYIIFVMLRDGK